MISTKVDTKISTKSITAKDGATNSVYREANSKPAVSYESLESRCKFLEEGVARLRLDLVSVKPCLADAASEMLTLKNQHAAELEQLKLEHQKELKEFMDTKATEYNALKAQHTMALVNSKTGFEKYIARQQRDLEILKIRSEGERKAFRAERAELQTEIDDPNETINDLVEKRENMKPLLDVGVAVRLRFLEKTRQTLRDGEISGIDKRIIEEGNTAAHSANADADIALARGGYIENNYSFNQMIGGTFK